MPKTKISEFSTTPGNNTDIDGINIAEGCAPSGINDAIRELMSQLKDFQTGAAGDPFNGAVNGTVGATTPSTGAFTTLSASGVITSTLATGTAPFSVTSTTPVTNLSIGGNAATATTATNVSGGSASVTTLTTSGAVTHNAGTANGVAYLNGSKVLTTGSALTFDGTNFGVGSAAPTVKFEANVGSSAAYFTRVAGDYGLTAPMVGILTSGTTGQIRSAGDLQIYTAAVGGSQTERLRIDSSGNLGLGVTPSAWGGSAKAFQINTAGALYSTGASVGVASNYYFDGTTNKYITSNFASLYYQTSGQHQWFTAPSGTAGNAISFTQAMTLDASGNWVVGRTSALSSGRASIQTSGTDAVGLAIRSLGGTERQLNITPSSTDGVIKYDGTGAASAGHAWLTLGTERARIDSSGNLLVGTTSGSYKVDVSGDVNVTGSYRVNGVATTGLTGGQTGSAPLYGARAWVNFNGTGTVAIRASGNVSSITDNGTGDYTLNFANAMPDANYACVTGSSNNTGIFGTMSGINFNTAPIASACRIYATNDGGGANDPIYVTVAIFR